MVEHDLAKVGVASSSLVFRSMIDMLMVTGVSVLSPNAEVVQLVVHVLAKHKVAGSNPVFRSN